MDYKPFGLISERAKKRNKKNPSRNELQRVCSVDLDTIFISLLIFNLAVIFCLQVDRTISGGELTIGGSFKVRFNGIQLQ